jgi:putative ABC transport system permease protein
MAPDRRPVRWLHALGLGKPSPEESAALEVEHHMAEHVDQLVAQGWTVEEARREAERRFGDQPRHLRRMRRLERSQRTREQITDRLDVVRQSLVTVLRTSIREPGFTAAIVLTLALGIGANATMYGILDRLLLRAPNHIIEPEQLRRVFSSRINPRNGEVLAGDLSYLDYADLKAHGGMTVAGYQDDYEHTIGSGASAFRARTHLATAELFTLLGVQPRLGRFFTAEESSVGAPVTVVLAEEFWRSAYGSDPAILSKTIEIDGLRVPVIGVAPTGFTGVDLRPVDIWLPLEAWSSRDPESRLGPTSSCLTNRGCRWMRAVARLGRGTTEQMAVTEATRLHDRARAEAGEPERTGGGASVSFGPLVADRGTSPSTESRVARWLGGVSLVVLLIACANVANLLLARGSKRRRDTAVRRALGVSRKRLVSQTVLETIVLALVGGAVALLLTYMGGGLVRSVLLPEVSFPGSPVGWRVVAYAVSVSFGAGLLASVGPAVAAGRFDVSDDLASGSRAHTEVRSRLRAALTVAQAALCVVLLVGAGLFVRSVGEIRGVDLGFDADRLLTADLEFTTAQPDPLVATEAYSAGMRAIGALPGVASVAATASPFGTAMTLRGVRIPGVDSLPQGAAAIPVGTGYFETVGVAIVDGRPIDRRDVAGADPVTVVSETMAAMVWPNDRAVGQCLIVGTARETCTTVVGVAEHAARGGLRDPPHMAYYLSMDQVSEIVPQVPQWAVPIGIYVRPSDNAPEDLEGEIARALRSISPEVLWARVIPMDDTLRRQARSWTLGATMFTVFGLLALLVAAVGLYSVLAFDVAQRTREIGIRTALGARKARLLRSVVSQGALLGVIGVALGLGVAYIAAPYIQDLLFEVPPRDVTVFAGVAIVLLGVSIAASLVPALRATRVDPVTALKAD